MRWILSDTPYRWPGCSGKIPGVFPSSKEIFRKDRKDPGSFPQEQAHEENSDYRFIRGNSFYNDTLSREGKGALVKSNTGLIWSGFRPSDDACTYGYLIPSNMFAVVVLGYLEEMEREIFHCPDLEKEARETLR